MSSADHPRRSSLWYWLLLVPCVAVLWVPFFNRAEPSLFGIPFFYWYQLAWVPLSVVVTGIVYFATSTRRP